MIRYLTQVKGLGKPNLHREMRQQEEKMQSISPAPVFSYEDDAEDRQHSELMSLLLKTKPKPSFPKRFYEGKSLRSADESVNIIESDMGRIVIPRNQYDEKLERLRVKESIKRQLKIVETEEMHRRFKLLVEKICPSARKRLVRMPRIQARSLSRRSNRPSPRDVRPMKTEISVPVSRHGL